IPAGPTNKIEVSLVRHSIPKRVRVVYASAENRAGSIELISLQVVEHILHWNTKLSNGQLASRVETNQHPAPLDEIFQIGDAGLAHSSTIFFRIRTRAVPINHLRHVLVGKYHNVESLFEVARSDVCVGDR